MDGMFSYSPKEFFQQYEIMSFSKYQNKFEIAVVFYLTSKSYESYFHAFNALQIHLKKHTGEKLRPTRILIDFESAVIRSCKEVFKPKTLEGCYFHAVQSWWKKTAKEVKFYTILEKFIGKGISL